MTSPPGARYNVSFWLEYNHHGEAVARGIRPASAPAEMRSPMHTSARHERKEDNLAAMAGDDRRRLYTIRTILLPGGAVRAPGAPPPSALAAREMQQFRRDAMPNMWDSQKPIRDPDAQPRSATKFNSTFQFDPKWSASEQRKLDHREERRPKLEAAEKRRLTRSCIRPASKSSALPFSTAASRANQRRGLSAGAQASDARPSTATAWRRRQAAHAAAASRSRVDTVFAGTVRARRLRSVSVFHSKFSLYGIFVWARTSLNNQTWRVPARADGESATEAGLRQVRANQARRPVKRQDASYPCRIQAGPTYRSGGRVDFTKQTVAHWCSC